MALALLLAALPLAPTPTQAHSTARSGPVAGLAIPAITHGEMQVLNPYRREILRLAAPYLHRDEELRRLVNFQRIQFANCLWGLMPGTLGDEASPFNTCAHAYLAATRAILLRLQMLPEAPPPLRTRLARIEATLRADPAAAAFCGFSADAYDTANPVGPEWHHLPGHPPSLLALALVLGGAAFGLSLLRRPV